MLGHALQATGSFGFPLEYGNPSNLAEWKKRLGVDGLPELVSAIQAIRTSPNGVFSIKIHYPHIDNFGGIDVIKKLFPESYFVFLTRKDLLNQAISLSIAKQTGVWISGQKGKG